MTNLMKFNAADLDQLMDKIVRNSIGMDDYLNNVFHTQTQSNYPPYNVVQLNNTETRLEIALAGFTKDEVKALNSPITFSVIDTTFSNGSEGLLQSIPHLPISNKNNSLNLFGVK